MTLNNYLNFSTYKIFMSLEKEVQSLKNRVEYLEEVMEIILDEELMNSIKKGLNDIKHGRVVKLEKVVK